MITELSFIAVSMLVAVDIYSQNCAQTENKRSAFRAESDRSPLTRDMVTQFKIM